MAASMCATHCAVVDNGGRIWWLGTADTCMVLRLHQYRAAEEVAAGRAEAAEQRAWARQTQEELGRRAESLAAGEARAEAATRELDRQAAGLQVLLAASSCIELPGLAHRVRPGRRHRSRAEAPSTAGR